jgi:6-pyruvoyltetrahydropterin/6-carboxytetrahydropterin synthase
MVNPRMVASRRIQFCAGHRVMGHEGKCRRAHGHNYTALVYAERDETTSPLDAIGRVVDFSVLKDKVGGWIEEHWDHKFLCYEADRVMISALDMIDDDFVVCPFNPTAEEMARFLLTVVCPKVLAGTGARAVGIELWETENCKAEAWEPCA